MIVVKPPRCKHCRTTKPEEFRVQERVVNGKMRHIYTKTICIKCTYLEQAGFDFEDARYMERAREGNGVLLKAW
jgi:hypothetical protein